jgi:hypothetical protein
MALKDSITNGRFYVGGRINMKCQICGNPAVTWSGGMVNHKFKIFDIFCEIHTPVYFKKSRFA